MIKFILVFKGPFLKMFCPWCVSAVLSDNDRLWQTHNYTGLSVPRPNYVRTLLEHRLLAWKKCHTLKLSIITPFAAICLYLRRQIVYCYRRNIVCYCLTSRSLLHLKWAPSLFYFLLLSYPFCSQPQKASLYDTYHFRGHETELSAQIYCTWTSMHILTYPPYASHSRNPSRCDVNRLVFVRYFLISSFSTATRAIISIVVPLGSYTTGFHIWKSFTSSLWNL